MISIDPRHNIVYIHCLFISSDVTGLLKKKVDYILAAQGNIIPYGRKQLHSQLAVKSDSYW
jgi:hypothetical protein